MQPARSLNRTITARAGGALMCLCLLPALLVGCTTERHDDLQRYVEQVRAKQKGRVAPLPEVKPHETFAYQAHDVRDPFTPPEGREEGPKAVAEGPTPDLNRRREALEDFPLDTLKFVGHLQREGTRWGLVQAPDNTVHRVQVGNHLGQNYGEILTISESRIELKELVPNGLGGWIERQASLSLGE